MAEETMHSKWKSNKITCGEYQNWCAQQRGFKNLIGYYDYLAQQKGFKNQKEYYNCLLQKNGFEDRSEYQKAWYKGFKTHEEYRTWLSLPKEESMYNKYKSKKITRTEYDNWCVQQKGFKNYAEYNNWWAQNKGFKNYNDFQRFKAQQEGYRNNNTRYYSTPNGKLAYKRCNAKRKKGLGYNVINLEDIDNQGYVGHHLDKENILFIPEKLHKSIPHSVLRNISMNNINEVAIEWYNSCHINGIDIKKFIN